MSNPESRRTGFLRLFCFLSLGAAFACSPAGTETGEPLSVELTVDRTSGEVGVDAFTFHLDATGRNLSSVVLEFGDGEGDSLAASGSTSAGMTRSHVYEAPGSYSAVARAVETSGEVLADTIVVTVQNS